MMNRRPLFLLPLNRPTKSVAVFFPQTPLRWNSSTFNNEAAPPSSFFSNEKKKVIKREFNEYSNVFYNHHHPHDPTSHVPKSTSSTSRGDPFFWSFPRYRFSDFSGSQNTFKDAKFDRSSNSLFEEHYPMRIQFSNSELPENQNWLAKYLKPGQIFPITELGVEKNFDDMKKRNFDLFNAMGVNPRKMYKHASLLSLFVTETGMIMHHRDTNLTFRNQRIVSKMIKRARAMGLIPYTSRLPLQKFHSDLWQSMNTI